MKKIEEMFEGFRKDIGRAETVEMLDKLRQDINAVKGIRQPDRANLYEAIFVRKYEIIHYS